MAAQDRVVEFWVATLGDRSGWRPIAHCVGRPFEPRATHAIAAESLDYSSERVGKEKRSARFFRGLIRRPTELTDCEEHLRGTPSRCALRVGAWTVVLVCRELVLDLVLVLLRPDHARPFRIRATRCASVWWWFALITGVSSAVISSGMHTTLTTQSSSCAVPRFSYF